MSARTHPLAANANEAGLTVADPEDFWGFSGILGDSREFSGDAGFYILPETFKGEERVEVGGGKGGKG